MLHITKICAQMKSLERDLIPRPFPYQVRLSYQGIREINSLQRFSFDNRFYNINYNSIKNLHEEILPNSIRIPNKQGNRLSLNQSYKDTTKKNVNDLDMEFWNNFEEYLKKSYRKSSLRCRILYAKQYYHVIIEENARDIIGLSHNKKLQIMKSLAILAKYLGCYDRWKTIKERYQLKWSNEDSIEIFQNLTNQEKNYSSMLKWVKNTCKIIPAHYANILIYSVLTGLRPTEVLSSINLIKLDIDNYLDKDKMILEHVKYPEIFIRKTKKAYISIVNESIIRIAKDTRECNYNSMRCYLKRRKIPFNFNYCRKIFATYLRMQGIEQEVIDLLQGRLPKSIFLRYYYRPDLSIYIKIQNKLQTLYKIINTN
jgi:intergrase/recombinase